MTKTLNTYCYVTDHLGSVRTTYRITGESESVPVQHISYMPSGAVIKDSQPSLQKMKFTGKELVTMHGWNMYDSGARFQYRVMPRFSSMDPLCEKYYSISPYAYCINNPVRFIDPDGRDVLIWYKDKHGKDQLFRFSGFHRQRSITIPNNQYVKDFIQAYLYNAKNGGGEKTIQAVTNHKYEIYVSDSQYNESYYSGGDGQSTVYWESRQGIITTDGGRQSAATILEHEMDHAVDDADNHKRHVETREKQNFQYNNMEEKRVITGSEAHTAISNRESVRNDHKGKNYKTISSISTIQLK